MQLSCLMADAYPPAGKTQNRRCV